MRHRKGSRTLLIVAVSIAIICCGQPLVTHQISASLTKPNRHPRPADSPGATFTPAEETRINTDYSK